MSNFKSFTKKASRPVLVATAIGAAPALFFLVLSIIGWLVPHKIEPWNDPQELEPTSMILAMSLFAFISAVATFIIAASIAFARHLLRQAWEKRELRRIGKRFGWTPQTK